MLTRIPLDKNNRMLRIGLGKHEGRWFFRVDLWWVGFRFSRTPNWKPSLRRVIPMTVAQDIQGVQPMAMPEGLIFNFRPYHYTEHTRSTGPK